MERIQVPEQNRPRKKCQGCALLENCTRNNPVDCPDYAPKSAFTKPPELPKTKTKEKHFFGKALFLGTLSGIGTLIIMFIIGAGLVSIFNLDLGDTEQVSNTELFGWFVFSAVPVLVAGFVAGKLSKPYPLRNALLTGCIINIPFLLPALLMPLFALLSVPSLLVAVLGGFLSKVSIKVGQ